MVSETPIPPAGWRLMAPSEAIPGDGALLPDGTIVTLDLRGFDPIPIEVRRKTWAVRRVGVECDEGCGAFEEPQTLDEYRAAEEHWKSHGCGFGCSHGR